MSWTCADQKNGIPDLSGAFESLHKHLVWMQEIVPGIIGEISDGKWWRVDDLKDALIERAGKEKISTALVPILIEEIIRRLESGELKGYKEEDEPPADDDTEDEKTKPGDPKDEQGSGKPPQPKPEPPPQPDPTQKKKKKRKGGRKAGQRNLVPADFKKSVTVFVGLDPEVKPGGICPCCHEKALEATRGAELIRYGASCPVPVTRVMVEKSRCKACGQHFEAELPQDWSRETCIGNLTPAAVAMSILLRYGLGFPDLRLETLQEWAETPLSTSTQWQVSLTLWESLLPLWQEFLLFAANADQRQLDDCSSRVIELRKEIEKEMALVQSLGLGEKQMRTGIQSTVVIATKDGVTIRLFVTGRRHQGEIEFELGQLRTVDSPVINITDAASKSESINEFPGQNEQGFVPAGSAVQKARTAAQSKDTGEAPARIHANCLEHLRQTLEKAQPGFKSEVGFFLDNLCEVFRLERESDESDHSSEDRLSWHRTHSLPVLERMKRRAEEELASNKKAEPNSEYARSLKYFLNHYEKFTAFTRHHDIPLTTSLAEAGAKFTKRHQKNSLSYQTQTGAQVGDAFMSVIATCMGMNINPLEYLESLARCRHDITPDTASDWLPHKYKAAEQSARERYEKRKVETYRLRPRRVKKLDSCDGSPQTLGLAPDQHLAITPLN